MSTTIGQWRDNKQHGTVQATHRGVDILRNFESPFAPGSMRKFQTGVTIFGDIKITSERKAKRIIDSIINSYRSATLPPRARHEVEEWIPEEHRKEWGELRKESV